MEASEPEENCSMEENNFNFQIFCQKTEFEKFIVEKVYACQDGNKTRHRNYYRLSPGEWEDWLADLIFDATKLKCGFNFANHQIRSDKKGGTINGR